MQVENLRPIVWGILGTVVVYFLIVVSYALIGPTTPGVSPPVPSVVVTPQFFLFITSIPFILGIIGEIVSYGRRKKREDSSKKDTPTHGDSGTEYCDNCGALMRAGNKFCKKCGARQN